MISVPPERQPARGAIVILHGWGANAQDIASIAPLLDLSDYWVLMPEAPLPHPYSMAGRMWYSFPENYNFGPEANWPGRSELENSRQLLLDWLQTLEAQTGIPLSRTILSGFSQGGAMTLDVGLRLPLAGLMILSGYLHGPLEPLAGAKPPVLVVHGRQDQVVPLASAHKVKQQLEQLGLSPLYQEYNMGHEISYPVLEQMQQFITQVLT